MLKKAYKIDVDGFYLEDYIYEEGQELETDIITIEMSQGFIKSKWDGTQWIEGATQEYIDSIKAPVTSQPTLEERVASAEEMLTMLMGV